MKIIILLIKVSAITCQINFIKNPIFNSFQYNRTHRCVKSRKIDSLVEKTLNLVEKNSGFSDFVNSFNGSRQLGQDEFGGVEYIRNHILKGLIVQDDLPETHWHEYKSVHNKVYKTLQQELIALSKWRDNLQRVARHNRDFLTGKQSYSLHLNRFGDLNVKEYFNNFLKLFHTFPLFDPAEDRHKTSFRRIVHRKVPRKFDWRARGFRPKHEEQNQCGACYAFTITHAVQAQLYKRHGFWGELSPQQIVDCSYRDGNQGCNGGSLRAALRYAARDGLIKESKYPYVGKKGRCKYNKFQVRVRAKRWATLPAHDEAAIEKALVTIGPLAVGLNAAPFTFQLYRCLTFRPGYIGRGHKLTLVDSGQLVTTAYVTRSKRQAPIRSGIYDDLFCTPWQLNHAMLLVGYTPQYWVLLNWWGENWGEGGYIRIRRGHNTCGVTNMATYVEI